MILSAHQPLYWGYLGTLHKKALADHWIDWDAVQAEDSGFENRTRVLGPGGAPQWLTVPVHKARAQTIRETRIVQMQGWQRKHFRTLEHVYKRAPHWEAHAPFLEDIYLQTKWSWLFDLNGTIRAYLARRFNIVRPTTSHSLLIKERWGTVTGDIVQACREVGADTYIFGPNGHAYVDLPYMRQCGVRALFQEYDTLQYEQGEKQRSFVPNLFPLDVLLWCGEQEARHLMMAGGTVVTEAA